MKDQGLPAQVVRLHAVGPVVQVPTSFADLEGRILASSVEWLEKLSPDDDETFSGTVRLVLNFFPLSLSQKEIASLLCVSPITLQRWSKGKFLPYPVPRRAYFFTILDILRQGKAEHSGVRMFASSNEYRLPDYLNAVDVCGM